MSLLDLILAQKGILLSIGLALLMLLAAAVLSIAARIRRLVRQRASARPVAQEAQPEEAPVEVQPQNIVEVTEIRTVQPAPDKPVEQAAPMVQASQPVQQEEQPQPEPQDSQSSAMQDILSSVFSDEEADARRGTLLNGLERVDISHLLALCNQVAAQLRAAGR